MSVRASTNVLSLFHEWTRHGVGADLHVDDYDGGQDHWRGPDLSELWRRLCRVEQSGLLLPLQLLAYPPASVPGRGGGSGPAPGSASGYWHYRGVSGEWSEENLDVADVPHPFVEGQQESVQFGTHSTMPTHGGAILRPGPTWQQLILSITGAMSQMRSALL